MGNIRTAVAPRGAEDTGRYPELRQAQAKGRRAGLSPSTYVPGALWPPAQTWLYPTDAAST